MTPRKLFGSLNLKGFVGKGENPNGMVTQTSNGTNVNGKGADGDDFTWGVPADGRWNKTYASSEGTLREQGVSRPIAIVAKRRN